MIFYTLWSTGSELHEANFNTISKFPTKIAICPHSPTPFIMHVLLTKSGLYNYYNYRSYYTTPYNQ